MQEMTTMTAMLGLMVAGALLGGPAPDMRVEAQGLNLSLIHI